MVNADNFGGKFFRDMKDDPNFLLILVGAFIWWLGYLIPLIGFIIITGGFALTCYATAVYAFKRPTTNAWPGMAFGCLLHIIGSYLLAFFGLIPFLNIIPSILIVSGGVMIIFFAVPLALQHGNEPLLVTAHSMLTSATKRDTSDKEETEEPESPDEESE